MYRSSMVLFMSIRGSLNGWQTLDTAGYTPSFFVLCLIFSQQIETKSDISKFRIPFNEQLFESVIVENESKNCCLNLGPIIKSRFLNCCFELCLAYKKDLQKLYYIIPTLYM